MVSHVSFPLSRLGIMFVISSPSGAGKTSLAEYLLKEDTDLFLSVSCTTRSPRPGEIDGKHYFFMNHDQFQVCLQQGEFLEYAQVFSYLYGTPKSPIYEYINQGKDVLFDVNWQGGQKIYQWNPDHVVRIFILPPSLSELQERLYKRAQDSPEIVKDRMNRVWEEIIHWNEYDYVLINDDFENTAKKLQQIVHTERLKRFRQKNLKAFIEGLLCKTEGINE